MGDSNALSVVASIEQEHTDFPILMLTVAVDDSKTVYELHWSNLAVDMDSVMAGMIVQMKGEDFVRVGARLLVENKDFVMADVKRLADIQSVAVVVVVVVVVVVDCDWVEWLSLPKQWHRDAHG